MTDILKTNLPKNKSVVFSLTYVYGIGVSTSTLICKKLGLSLNLKTKDLTNEQISDLLKLVNLLKLPLNNELRKINILSLKKLIDIKSYRGLRRLRGLPVRGQRTHTNARSSRRNKRSSTT